MDSILYLDALKQMSVCLGKGAGYCDQFVCLCVSVFPRAYLWNAGPIVTKFLCKSPVVVVRRFSGVVAISYVLPVLWMTSRLAVMRHRGGVWCLRMSCCGLLWMYISKQMEFELSNTNIEPVMPVRYDRRWPANMSISRISTYYWSFY